MPENKGKAKGKMKLDVCRWDDDTQEWKLRTMPAHAAAVQVSHGIAVYAVDGMCPIDPPVFEAEEATAD